jgi:hypothetical protein
MVDMNEAEQIEWNLRHLRGALFHKQWVRDELESEIEELKERIEELEGRLLNG